MIRDIEIENVRGIRQGRVQELAALTVLTGHNGSGKSSVLDALLIGASPRPGDAVGRAVRRHPASSNGARWLVREGTRTVVTLDAAPLAERLERRFVRHDDEVFEVLREQVSRGALRKPITSVEVLQILPLTVLPVQVAVVALDVDNAYKAAEGKDGSGSYVRIVDPGIPAPLSTSYSKLVREGRKQGIVDSVQAVLPAVRDLELLEDAPGAHSLYLLGDSGPVPSGVSGDGIHAFLQIAIELSAIEAGGTALLEEPEVYQHPRALGRTADLLVATVQRGVQVVLTTHSLELIDEVTRAAARKDLPQDDLALFNLALVDGSLRSTRRSGADLTFARTELELDPR